MKSKMIVPTLNPRNPFVMLARKRSAGSHVKPHKAKRKLEKQKGYSSDGQSTALLMRESSVQSRVPLPLLY